MENELASFDKELEELLHSNWQAAIKNDGQQKVCEPITSAILVDQWEGEDAELVKWFQSATDLPKQAFKLKEGVRVIDCEKFYASLRVDIASGSKGCRALFGAVQSDLKALKEFIEKNKEKKEGE